MPYPEPDAPPTRPIDAYKNIVDALVEQTPSNTAKRPIEKAQYTGAHADEPINDFVRSLTSEQRAFVAEMLNRERLAGIGAVLAELTWWIDCHELAWTFHGQPMPLQLSGMGLHGDYIGRLDGWRWPDTQPAHS